MISFRRVFGFCLIASGLIHTAHAEFRDPDFIVVQSLLRMQDAATLVRSNDDVRRAVNRYLDEKRGQRELLAVVGKLELRDQTHRLAEFFNEAADVSLQVEATRLLLASGQEDYLRERLSAGDRTSVSIAKALGMTNDRRSVRILAPYVTADVPASLRIAAADGLGKSSRGQESLVSLYQSGELPLECHYVVYNSLLNSKVAHAKEVVVHLAPPPTTGGEALPPMRKLVRMRGDGKRGKATFHGKGTCAKCHKVHGEGKDIGPDLSEIGSKLSREAMYTAILNPNAGISHNYEQYGIVTADGLVLNGLLVNQTEAEVTLKTAEGVDRTIPADDIEEMVRRDVSLMPENLHQLMTVQELVDMVDYLILLTKKTQSGSHVDRPNADQSQQTSSHQTADALAGVEIADDLTARLFSAEPELRNPSNIDVDHLGRVWVCEVVNYRHFRNPNNPVRSEGDRILVLEDTDRDGVADKTTVFYQGTDVNSAHGICVLGERVIISAGDRVCSFYDDDGDLVADRKEVMFSGIGGVEHDHGIHAFVPGPDGKLYFNFGNEGRQIKDAEGNLIVDRSGREVRDHGKPYQQGMVFRCDLDGSNVETLAWNFRNNWELCVDSFGTIWQSDNDDDGNRATRINYVMPFGNYGYRGEMDGSSWRVPRTGMHEDIPGRHWHLRDPGVIPNVVQTGAGSPTGIVRYEGESLPPRYHNELIHCDPGPNSVRMYQLETDGAGYVGEQREMMTGTRDRWFRPVDVCVAPDGSLFVADWYDPGVGGHRMGDTERGRVFRVTGRDGADRFDVPEVDFETLEGTITGLKSPNVSTRFLAAERLRQMKDEADQATVVERLTEMARRSPIAYQRARALWVLAALDTHRAVRLAAQDNDPNVRCVGIRIAKQHDMNVVKVAERFATDESPQVRREAALSLRGLGDEMVPVWVSLATQHDGNDRWYIEALGIAAEGNWDACLTGWIETVGDQWDTRAGRDLIWRSRASTTSEWLAKILAESEEADDSARYLRAFDFQPDTPKKQNALRSVAEVVSKR